MRNILFLSFLCLAAQSNAVQSTVFPKEDYQQACNDRLSKEGYQAFLDCTKNMTSESDKRLTKRLTELRAALDKLSLKEYRIHFEQDQKAWGVWKKAHCAYLTTGMQRQACQIQNDICTLTENDRRLDALKDEPAFP